MAVTRPRGITAGAVTARVVRHDDAVADFDLADVLAYLQDMSRTLVAQDDRMRNRENLVAHGDVVVSTARDPQAHTPLVVTGSPEVQILKPHGSVALAHHSGTYLHVKSRGD